MGRAYPLHHELLIGRAGEADAWLDEEGVSRQHARVVRTDGKAEIVDLGSSHGTLINGRRITGPQTLQEGDLVQIGPSHVLRFVFQERLDGENAFRDPLTGAYVRGSFLDQLRKDVSSAIRHRQHLSLARLELDPFSQPGDGVGDLVLRHFSRVVATLIRSEDTFGRMGPGEFALILRQCPEDEAKQVTERIRQCVEQLDLMHVGQRVGITVSVGVTSLDAGLATGDVQLLETTQQALAEARRQGRNRVVFQSLT